MAETLSRENPRAFVENLTKPQRKTFDELRELVAHQQSSLSWYHAAGAKVIELQELVAKRERGWTRGLAAALGLSPSTLTKVRKFAADFTRRQVERLDQRGGGWGLVLAVQHARTHDRMKLLEEALAKGWGVVDLQAAVKQRFGVHNPGGRPLRKPQNLAGGLMQLQALGERWLRFYREVWAGGDEPLQDQVPDMSTKDRQRLAGVLPGIRSTVKQIEQTVLDLDKFLGNLQQKARRS